MPADEPDLRAAQSPVPDPTSPYWRFYAQVAAEQLAAWLPPTRARVLDLSGDGPERACQLHALGHEVLRVGAGDGSDGFVSVVADPRDLAWLADACVDAVVAESRALSMSLATEETVRDLARVLRPGGRLLLVVDSLLTGLARLADQGRWSELADVPSADVVLVPAEDGTITRCFWPEELLGLLSDAGLAVDWVRPRSVLTPAAVERGLAHGGDDVLRTLVRTELRLAAEREGEAVGMHLVASAHRPA
ncbi:MAG: methyltransferase domain-containing protein [Mycobacteriales bacterium]